MLILIIFILNIIIFILVTILLIGESNRQDLNFGIIKGWNMPTLPNNLIDLQNQPLDFLEG